MRRWKGRKYRKDSNGRHNRSSDKRSCTSTSIPEEIASAAVSLSGINAKRLFPIWPQMEMMKNRAPSIFGSACPIRCHRPSESNISVLSLQFAAQEGGSGVRWLKLALKLWPIGDNERQFSMLLNTATRFQPQNNGYERFCTNRS